MITCIFYVIILHNSMKALILHDFKSLSYQVCIIYAIYFLKVFESFIISYMWNVFLVGKVLVLTKLEFVLPNNEFIYLAVLMKNVWILFIFEFSYNNTTLFSICTIQSISFSPCVAYILCKLIVNFSNVYLCYLYWPHGRTAVTIIVTADNGLPAVFLWNILLLCIIKCLFIRK